MQNVADETNATIASAIIQLGHAFGLRVVAEGVETLDQLAVFRQKRCDGAQGFLFSKPIACDDFVAWLRDYKAPIWERLPHLPETCPTCPLRANRAA